MKFMVELAITFFKYVIIFLGCSLILFVLNVTPFQDIVYLLHRVYHNVELRLFVGGIASLMLILNFFFVKTLSGYQQRGKTIAFDNPSGRVSVSLAALEDLIRRVIISVPEVKEVRPSIAAGKKGIEVHARVILKADVNLPEMTSRLQDVVKSKIQDTIGIEEQVTVRVDVVKIIPVGQRVKKKEVPQEPDTPEEDEPQIPFQGYRA